MIQNRWDQSLSPGNEQAFYWSSAAADENGSRNYMGVKSPAVDALIAALRQGAERADVVAAVRALDRVLISGFYTVPLFHPPEQWIARWTSVAHPAVTSLMGYIPETWWRGRSETNRDPQRSSSTDRWRTGIGSPRHARRPVPPGGDPAAERHRAGRSAQPRELHRRRSPGSLTYAQADRMISAIAGRLRRMGLRRDAIVGLQIRAIPSRACSSLLAVLRAGLIAMPLPLLWRRAEAVAALNRVGANALIVSGRIGAVDHFDARDADCRRDLPDPLSSAASAASRPTA